MYATPAGAAAPADPLDQLRRAWQLRPSTDYIFGFGTALGWTIVTFGAYWYYVLFQMVRRIGEHNKRRHLLLEAAAGVAWQQAQVLGRAEELRGDFERLGADLARLRAVASSSRDPVIWLLLSLITGGVAGLVAYVLIDGDLAEHEAAEAGVEADLARLLGTLGIHPQTADTAVQLTVKGRHRYLARFVVLVLTLGFYGFWWTRDIMVEGNTNFRENWRSEDPLVEALRAAR